MHARSTVLHGGGLGGLSLPQGHSPTDMVNCVCNLPHGASSGVLWESGGVREVLGEVFEGSWGALRHYHFPFFGGDFVNCVMKYLCFQFCVFV